MQQLIPPMGGSIEDADVNYVHVQMNSPEAASGHGFYPINDQGFWHGGVHLGGTSPVRAIADGELVAYRINDIFCEGELNDQNVEFSNSFVLLKHKFKTPKGEEIEFFSLYMHLLPGEILEGDQIKRLPPVFWEYVYTVTTEEDGMGLAIYDDEGIKIAVAPFHAYVEVLNEHPEKLPWMSNKTYAIVIYDGLFQGYALLNGHAKKIQNQTWQVLSNKDAPMDSKYDRGLNVRARDKGDAQVLRIVPKGGRVVFKNTESKTKPKILADGKRHELEGGGYIYKTANTIQCSPAIEPKVVYNEIVVCRTPISITQGQVLGYPGLYLDRGPMIHFEIFTADATLTKCLTNCKDEVVEPPSFVKNAKAEKLGRKILKLKEGAVLSSRKIALEKIGANFVEKTTFEPMTNPIAPGRYGYEVGIPYRDATGITYREVVYNLSSKKSGWISEADPMVEAVYSPYDWNSIWEVIEDKDFSDDGFCDAEKLFKELDKDGDKRINATEIKDAIKDVKTNHWLKHLICVHPTEWDSGQNDSKWKRLKEDPWNFKGKHASRYDQAMIHIQKMQWWSTVKAAYPSLPDAKRVYHFHPIGFMEHFNMLAMPFTMNDAWWIIDKVAVAESGGLKNPYADTRNRDLEYKGAENGGIEMKYSGIVHIGLSYGMLSFAQDVGTLGDLLVAMKTENETLFKEVFGENYLELIKMTTAKGTAGIDIWSAAPYFKKKKQSYIDESKPVPEIRSVRVQKVAVKKNGTKYDLWEDEWVDRFKKAGEQEVFKQIQRKLAFNKFFVPAVQICSKFGIRTTKGLAIAFDRCVQQGPGRPPSEGDAGTGAQALFSVAFESFKAMYGSVRPENEWEFLDFVRRETPLEGWGRKRVGELLASTELNQIVYDERGLYDLSKI